MSPEFLMESTIIYFNLLFKFIKANKYPIISF